MPNQPFGTRHIIYARMSSRSAGGTLRVVCFGIAQSGRAEACAAIGIVEQRDHGVRHLMG
jgi:hypothetical protein